MRSSNCVDMACRELLLLLGYAGALAGLSCYDCSLCYSVGREKRGLAEICVKAVLAVADLERKDVNLDLIKVMPLRH